MILEEKIARALAAAFILGRNNAFSSVDELWPSWVPEAKRVLEGYSLAMITKDEYGLLGSRPDVSYYQAGVQTLQVHPLDETRPQ